MKSCEPGSSRAPPLARQLGRGGLRERLRQELGQERLLGALGLLMLGLELFYPTDGSVHLVHFELFHPTDDWGFPYSTTKG